MNAPTFSYNEFCGIAPSITILQVIDQANSPVDESAGVYSINVADNSITFVSTTDYTSLTVTFKADNWYLGTNQ